MVGIEAGSGRPTFKFLLTDEVSWVTLGQSLYPNPTSLQGCHEDKKREGGALYTILRSLQEEQYTNVENEDWKCAPLDSEASWNIFC